MPWILSRYNWVNIIPLAAIGALPLALASAFILA